MLLFDVGSGSVGGAIAVLGGGFPSILYAVRREIPHGEQTADRLLAKMLQALSSVLHLMLHEGFDSAGFRGEAPDIAEALVFLSAPWAISRTDFLHLKNDKSIPITEDLFRELLINHKRENEAAHTLVPIEQKLIKAELNGYETATPYSKAARHAVFAIFSSFSEEEVVRKTEALILRTLHPRRVSFHSFSLSAAAALQTLYPEVPDFLVLDVSGEQTEVAVVKEGVLLETITFPFGRNHFIRRLARNTGAPAASVSSFFKLYGEGRGEGPLFEAGEKSASRAGSEWLNHFERAVSAFSAELFLPPTVFVTVDEDIRSFIAKLVRQVDVGTITPGGRPFRPVHVTEDLLDSARSSASPAGRSEGSQRSSASIGADPFLQLEAVFSGKLRGESPDV